jgi:hypothetical protein
VPERHDEAGSTLLLVPSAVLVLFLLTALAVDGAATFLAQRELADACAGAANDAATVALDPGRLYGGGGPPVRAVDLDRAVAVAQSRAAPLAARWDAPVEATADTDGPVVLLHLRATAPLPIGPGGAGRARVGITATCRSTSIRR